MPTIHSISGQSINTRYEEELVALPPLPAYIVSFRMLIIFDDCVNIS